MRIFLGVQSFDDIEKSLQTLHISKEVQVKLLIKFGFEVMDLVTEAEKAGLNILLKLIVVLKKRISFQLFE